MRRGLSQGLLVETVFPALVSCVARPPAAGCCVLKLRGETFLVWYVKCRKGGRPQYRGYLCPQR
jgi:hypothetical protein